MVTLAEQWINEGIERGIEQGIERGIEQGIERGIEQGESNKLEMLVCNMALKRKLKVKEIAEIAELVATLKNRHPTNRKVINGRL
jgi:flagellar biosynthesis/type III secretory pathway protein FliH